MSGTPAADLAGLVMAGVFGGAPRLNSGWFGGTADDGANGDDGDVATRPSRAWRGLRPRYKRLRSCGGELLAPPKSEHLARQSAGLAPARSGIDGANDGASPWRAARPHVLDQAPASSCSIPPTGPQPSRDPAGAIRQHQIGGLAPTLTRRNRGRPPARLARRWPWSRSHLVGFRSLVQRSCRQEPRPEPVHNYSLISTLRTGCSMLRSPFVKPSQIMVARRISSTVAASVAIGANVNEGRGGEAT